MSRNQKKSKAVPIVMIVTLLVAALAVGCFLLKPMITDPIKKAATEDMNRQRADIDRQNADLDAAYQAELLELTTQTEKPVNPTWPEHSSEGWDLIDLSDYPLDNPTAERKTRAELMNNGMLLVNQWHSRPDDFDDSKVVSVGRYLGGNEKMQVKDYNVRLFPVAADALLEAVNAAKAEGMEHYIIDEGYRSYDEQNALFQKRMNSLSGKYKGDALIEATKREVNYPGTSEYNTGLAFTLRLYDKNDAEVGVPKYSTTPQAAWMAENCWKYGLIVRFPQAGWPLPTTQDKSFKTGVTMKLNLYRYVGKGHAAIMHHLDMCLEEYIEYLQEHPHIALFVDGVLKYEVYYQYVGDADSFDVQLTRSPSHVSSLDNMGAVITVFEY